MIKSLQIQAPFIPAHNHPKGSGRIVFPVPALN